MRGEDEKEGQGREERRREQREERREKRGEERRGGKERRGGEEERRRGDGEWVERKENVWCLAAAQPLVACLSLVQSITS